MFFFYGVWTHFYSFFFFFFVRIVVQPQSDHIFLRRSLRPSRGGMKNVSSTAAWRVQNTHVHNNGTNCNDDDYGNSVETKTRTSRTCTASRIRFSRLDRPFDLYYLKFGSPISILYDPNPVCYDRKKRQNYRRSLLKKKTRFHWEKKTKSNFSIVSRWAFKRRLGSVVPVSVKLSIG